MKSEESDDSWILLRRGEKQQALDFLRERYQGNPSPSHIMELGVAYLWVEDYELAWQHFQHAIETDHTPGDIYYGMAGVAKWCQGDPAAAIERWLAGLSVPYALGGVGIHLPLLLYLASIFRPELYPRDQAEQRLTSKIKDPRSRHWPGPLARLVLGQIDDTAIEAEWSWNRNGVCVVLSHRKWLTRFYKMALQLATGNMPLNDFKKSIGSLVDTTSPEWSEKPAFLDLLWCTEFYIARCEAFHNCDHY